VAGGNRESAKGRPLVLYGYHPVREALRHRPHLVAKVLISATRAGRRREEIEDLCQRHRVACEVVPDRVLAAVAGPAHNGMAAELLGGAAGGGGGDTRGVGGTGGVRGAGGARDAGGARGTGAGRRSGGEGGAVEDADRQTGRAADPDFIVLLEDVQDPRNLGAVLRVCEGAGVGQVLIRDRGSAPITPAVAKTAAGATEWLAIERITNSAATLESLKKDGFWVYGTDPEGQPPWALDLSGKVVLCFGGEERGLRPRTRSLCDATVGIPMLGQVGSLNIATAAAAILYDTLRQRLSRQG
jgi:tRNA G18 (ribose-2'-O)-methylase SpoU